MNKVHHGNKVWKRSLIGQDFILYDGKYPAGHRYQVVGLDPVTRMWKCRSLRSTEESDILYRRESIEELVALRLFRQ